MPCGAERDITLLSRWVCWCPPPSKRVLYYGWEFVCGSLLGDRCWCRWLLSQSLCSGMAAGTWVSEGKSAFLHCTVSRLLVTAWRVSLGKGQWLSCLLLASLEERISLEVLSKGHAAPQLQAWPMVLQLQALGWGLPETPSRHLQHSR